MKVRNMIDEIIEKGNNEDMYKLHDMLDELICDLKVKNPKLYHEYKKELYETAYGKVIMEDKAKEIVEHMLPYGENCSLEEAKEIRSRYNMKHDPVDIYLVLNSLYNDYHELLGDDEEMYAKMTKLWLNDVDAKPDKVYIYFCEIPKED